MEPKRSEERWNKDLIDYISSRINPNGDWRIESATIPKDCSFGIRDNKKVLKIHFSARDIVIYKDTIDISKRGDGIVFESISKEQNKSNQIPIPKVVIELKYNLDTSDTIFKEAAIVDDLRKIFSDCVYVLIIYNSRCMGETLLRNGSSFDKIFVLKTDSSKAKAYDREMFDEDLTRNDFRERMDLIVQYILNGLLKNKVE